MSYDEHQAMWPQMIATLAAIDAELGMPEDGCNSPAMTLVKLRQWRAALEAAYKVLDGNVVLMRRAIRPDPTGGRFSYIQARDGAMLEATGPINTTEAAKTAIRAALGA
jgi:hypothetical protein